MEVGAGLYGVGEDLSLIPIAYCLFILRQGLYVSSGILFEKQGLVFCIKEAPFPGREPQGAELQPVRPFPLIPTE